jgi:hypothetical protein
MINSSKICLLSSKIDIATGPVCSTVLFRIGKPKYSSAPKIYPNTLHYIELEIYLIAMGSQTATRTCWSVRSEYPLKAVTRFNWKPVFRFSVCVPVKIASGTAAN